MNYAILPDNELIAAHNHLDDKLTDLAAKRQKLDDAIEALEQKRFTIRAKLGRPSVWAKDDEYKAIIARKETLKAKRAIVVNEAFNTGHVVTAIRIIAGARGGLRFEVKQRT